MTTDIPNDNTQHPERAWFYWLLRTPGLSAAEAAAMILDEGRAHGAQANQLTGAKLRRWVEGQDHIPGWAYRAALVVAVRHGYMPQWAGEVAAVARAMRAAGCFNDETIRAWWPTATGLWSEFQGLKDE